MLDAPRETIVEALLVGLVALACPVGMGVMMWGMMRGSRSHRPKSASGEQVAQLRAEVDQLRQTQAFREQAAGSR